MMAVKLTLLMNEQTIAKAKLWAKAHHLLSDNYGVWSATIRMAGLN